MTNIMDKFLITLQEAALVKEAMESCWLVPLSEVSKADVDSLLLQIKHMEERY